MVKQAVAIDYDRFGSVDDDHSATGGVLSPAYVSSGVLSPAYVAGCVLRHVNTVYSCLASFL